jgi:formate dehydrogenase major subunit
MELYISDHPLDCLTCAANGDCELQDQAGAVGLRDVRYGYEGDNHLVQEKDTSNPYFDFDPTKCIVCSRCVRACDEVQGTFALTIDGRGFSSKSRRRRTTISSRPNASRAAPASRPARPRR